MSVVAPPCFRSVVSVLRPLQGASSFLLSALLLLAPLKFTVPVNLQALSIPPSSVMEWLFWSWPNSLGVSAAGLLWVGLALERTGRSHANWLSVLVWLWLLTQALAVPTAICLQTAVDTLLHFAVCVMVFQAASRCARDGKREPWLFRVLTVATVCVCLLALEQHFGGLEATRRYAADHVALSDLQRGKLGSRRVFGPFPSPNLLGGFLALGFAPVLAWLWSSLHSRGLRLAAVMLAAAVMLSCLVMSGSRGGLLALATAGAVWWAVAKSGNRWRWAAAGVAAVFLAGAIAIGAGWMHLGRSSWEARRDYWSGALRIFRDYPWLGTGPGTFGSVYPKYKTAATEEAQLVHNSFLQMGSDSGVAALVVFVALWIVGLSQAIRVARERDDIVSPALAAALTAWTMHGLLDFDLYVPGVAWPAFALLGMVHGRAAAEVPACATVRFGGRTLAAAALATLLGWYEARMCAALWSYGRATRSTGQEKVRAAMAAVRWAPWHPQYWAFLGDVALRSGDAELAVAAGERAVALDPMRAALHYHLAVTYWWSGQRTKALSALRQAVTLNPSELRYRALLKTAEER